MTNPLHLRTPFLQKLKEQVEEQAEQLAKLEKAKAKVGSEGGWWQSTSQARHEWLTRSVTHHAQLEKQATDGAAKLEKTKKKLKVWLHRRHLDITSSHAT